MSTSKPRTRRTTPPGTDDDHSMMYHDVPFPELEAARAQGTIVVAACGFSFFPQPIPVAPVIVDRGADVDIELVAAVQLIRCKVCADINQNYFGDRPEHGEMGP